jgi:hypothetical protein
MRKLKKLLDPDRSEASDRGQDRLQMESWRKTEGERELREIGPSLRASRAYIISII